MSERATSRAVLLKHEGEEITQALPQWRLDWIHLGEGPVRHRAVTLQCGEMQASLLSFGCNVVLRGAAPDGFAAVSLEPESPPARVHGRPLAADLALTLAARAEFDIFFPAGCRALVVSGKLSGAAAAEPQLRSLTPEHLGVLQRCAQMLSVSEVRTASVLTAEQTPEEAQVLLTKCLELFAASSPAPLDARDPIVRRTAVSRACKRIDETLRTTIRLADLCEAAAVSARTLEYGFQGFYGVGPMAYVRCVRLSHVHRDLLAARRIAGAVAKAARHWGFTHMGQFSRDYRLLFGVSPSITLARARPDLTPPRDIALSGVTRTIPQFEEIS